MKKIELIWTFDLIFDLQGQMPFWQPGDSESLDHSDTFWYGRQFWTKNAIKSFLRALACRLYRQSLSSLCILIRILTWQGNAPGTAWTPSSHSWTTWSRLRPPTSEVFSLEVDVKQSPTSTYYTLVDADLLRTRHDDTPEGMEQMLHGRFLQPFSGTWGKDKFINCNITFICKLIIFHTGVELANIKMFNLQRKLTHSLLSFCKNPPQFDNIRTPAYSGGEGKGRRWERLKGSYL